MRADESLSIENGVCARAEDTGDSWFIPAPEQHTMQATRDPAGSNANASFDEAVGGVFTRNACVSFWRPPRCAHTQTTFAYSFTHDVPVSVIYFVLTGWSVGSAPGCFTPCILSSRYIIAGDAHGEGAALPFRVCSSAMWQLIAARWAPFYTNCYALICGVGCAHCYELIDSKTNTSDDNASMSKWPPVTKSLPKRVLN